MRAPHHRPVAGLDPATHVFLTASSTAEDVDARVKPGQWETIVPKHFREDL